MAETPSRRKAAELLVKVEEMNALRSLTSLVLSLGLLSAQAPPKPAAPAAVKPAAVAPAKPAAAPQAAKPPAPAKAGLTVDRVIQLVKAKLPEAAILSQIKNAKLTASVDDLLRVKEAGASDGIINALSGAGEETAPSVSAGTPSVTIGAKATGAGAAVAAVTLNTDLSTIQCQTTPQAKKRVVAVEEFEYGTVRTAVQAVFGTDVNIGKGILAMFTKRLAEEGKFRVVERANIKKVLGEQDFGASNRVKQGTQSRIGKILGADAILMGTITVFGRDDKSKGIDTSGVSNRLGGVFGRVKVSSREDKAVVVISYRLVDAETSEVIDTGEARGESKRKSSGFSVAGIGSGTGAGVANDMTSSNFAQTIIGEATTESVDKMAAILNNNSGKIQMKASDVETRIADIAGKQLILAAGGNDGMQKCDRFEVHKIIREVKDPVTKETIDVVTEKVGDALVTEVRERVSIAYFNGVADPQIGYLVRKAAQ